MLARPMLITAWSQSRGWNPDPGDLGARCPFLPQARGPHGCRCVSLPGQSLCPGSPRTATCVPGLSLGSRHPCGPGPDPGERRSLGQPGGPWAQESGELEGRTQAVEVPIVVGGGQLHREGAQGPQNTERWGLSRPVGGWCGGSGLEVPVPHPHGLKHAGVRGALGGASCQRNLDSRSGLATPTPRCAARGSGALGSVLSSGLRFLHHGCFCVGF